jgi:hypothetical protein
VVVEGNILLSVKGMPDRMIKAADGFEIAPEVPYSLKNGPQPGKIVASYTVERGKPPSAPAPE